jgi:hypothetical protein
MRFCIKFKIFNRSNCAGCLELQKTEERQIQTEMHKARYLAISGSTQERHFSREASICQVK